MTTIGLISDLHVLSRYGLVPPAWRRARDPLLPIQEYLWACYADFVARCPALDALLIVGDVIEGTIQLRAEPRGVVSDDESDQLDAAEETLAPLVGKARETYLVAGTSFHDGAGGRLEAIGRRLGAVPWAGGRYAGQVLHLEIAGKTINASHHQTRGWMWLGGAASRVAVLAAAAEAAAKLPHADLIVRGDLHSSLQAKVLGKWVCFLPGWTMPNPHAIKRMEAVRAHLATDIGAAVCIFGPDHTVGWLEGCTYPLARQEVIRAGRSLVESDRRGGGPGDARTDRGGRPVHQRHRRAGRRRS
jgi:hypothetical protein